MHLKIFCSQVPSSLQSFVPKYRFLSLFRAKVLIVFRFTAFCGHVNSPILFIYNTESFMVPKNMSIKFYHDITILLQLLHSRKTFKLSRPPDHLYTYVSYIYLDKFWVLQTTVRYQTVKLCSNMFRKYKKQFSINCLTNYKHMFV